MDKAKKIVVEDLLRKSTETIAKKWQIRINNHFRTGNWTKLIFIIVFLCFSQIIHASDATSYEYLPRTVSRYDKSKTRTGTACENYNDYDTYGYQICDENATCSNSTVSGVDYIYCTCNEGFTDDNGDDNYGAYSPLFGYGCVDEDECTLGTDDCDENATCENTSGSYTCTCDQGYYGDGTSCNEIDDVLSNCEPGYYSLTNSNSTCEKFFDVTCNSNGTADVKVALTYVNNILVYPYNQTQNLVEIGFLDPDCSGDLIDYSESIENGEQFYTYSLSLSECGFRVLRDLQGMDYFDNAVVLTSPYFLDSSQTNVSSKSDYTIFRFQCVYNSSENVSSDDYINHDVDIGIYESGTYSVSIESFLDANFSLSVDSETELFDEDAVYVKISSDDGIDEIGREIVIENCWINDIETDFMKFDIEIISDFCVNENFTEILVEENRDWAGFVFYPFLIDDNFEQVWISCSVYFKEVDADDVDCSSARRRRRAIKNELGPTVHQGTVQDEFRLKHGPITRRFNLLK